MARWSKFEKRMRERLIDDVKIKMSKRVISKHEGQVIVRFVLLYKDETLINYPQTEDKIEYMHLYSPTALCAMTFIDGYFSMKHDTAFKMNAWDIFHKAYLEKEQRTPKHYWNRTDIHDHFMKTMADDLMLILKICDRRTGKRSLQKLDVESLKPEFQRIVRDRLNTKE